MEEMVMRAEPTAVAQIPDSRGINLYRADRDAAPLLQHYLPDDLFRHLEPKLDRLGALAGDRLDRLAATADKNPPTLSVRLQYWRKSWRLSLKTTCHPKWGCQARAG